MRFATLQNMNYVLKSVLYTLVLLMLCMAHDVEAKDIYTTRTGLSCDWCHSRIPRLNEMGERYKSNGYSLEDKAPAPSEATPPQTDAQSTPELKSQEKTGDMSGKDAPVHSNKMQI